MSNTKEKKTKTALKVNTYIKVVCSSQLFKGCTQHEVTTMLACLDAKVKRFSKDEFLLRETSNVRAIGLLLSGSALVIREDVWGNRNILTKVTPAQTFGTALACMQTTSANVSVVACENANVMFLDINKILTVCNSVCAHHNKIISNLIAELAQKNLNLSEKVNHLTKRTTKEKIMSYLSSEAKTAGGREFDISFSRQQLADYLSVERSGLCSELAKLQNAGLIEYHKNHFTIKI